MFKKILVPVDGSENSYRAAKTAASMAEKYNSHVTLIYVLSIPVISPSLSTEAGTIPETVIESLKNEGQKILKDVKATFGDIPVETLMTHGNPAQEIIDVSEKGYDLIIMGSRGLGAIKGLVMGSVSNKITHHARCTVMLVH